MGFDRARRTPAGVAGRSALVTGGASGIGRAIAERLAAEGAGVIVVDLPSEALDAAVANAGLQHVSPLEEFPEEAWDRLLAVMLTAPFLLARALLPGMYAAGWGRVINIASVHGLVASPFKSAYVAAKHGLVGLTKVIALEAAARCPDVTAHAICPSYVRTPLVERQIEAQARAHGIDPQDVVAEVLLEANAVKRLLEPADVADAVVYLCGPSAWALTGGAFALDAGWLAH